LIRQLRVNISEYSKENNKHSQKKKESIKHVDNNVFYSTFYYYIV